MKFNENTRMFIFTSQFSKFNQYYVFCVVILSQNKDLQISQKTLLQEILMKSKLAKYQFFRSSYQIPAQFLFVIPNWIRMKQPPELFYKKRCSQKFSKIQRKTPVPESLFLNRAAGLRLQKVFTEQLRATASDLF